MKQKEEQMSLFDPDMPYGKMCPVRTVQTAERTSFPSHGARWTRNIGECPKDAVECGLSQILEDEVPPKYYLSAKACKGILKRAKRRGVALDPRFQEALERQAKVQTAGWMVEWLIMEEFQRQCWWEEKMRE